jgi:hypothetical protein
VGNIGGNGGAAGRTVKKNGYPLTWLGGNDGVAGTHTKGAEAP